MNATVLFPDSPFLSFAALEQTHRTVPAGNPTKKVRKSKAAHRRRQRTKRQTTTTDDTSFVTVLVDGREHHVKVSTKQEMSKKNAGGNRKRDCQMKRTSKIKSHPKKMVAVQKHALKENGMLPEERAYQLSIRPVQPKDDSVSMEQKQAMLKDLEKMTSRLAIQRHTLPEERAYQRLIKQTEESRWQQVLKELAAMRKLVKQGTLPYDNAYRQLMEEATTLSMVEFMNTD